MKILLVCGRAPWPPRRGDQLRSVQLLEALAAEHEVTLLSPPGRRSQVLGPATFQHRSYRPDSSLGRLPSLLGCVARGLPAQCGLYLHAELTAQVRQLAPRHDVVILQLARLAPLLEQAGTTPVIVDLIDALSLSFQTRAAIDRGPIRPFLRSEARRLERAERQLVAASRRALLVSDRDRSWLAERMPELAERLVVVPLRVEAARRAPSRLPGEPPVVALTGNLGYFANQDAVGWWLDHVWPELSRRRPELQLRVAGDRPPKSLQRRVARAGGRLEARPNDLRSVLAAAQVAVAPLRCGAGMPVKILEAWSVGVPMVTSRWAAEGAGAADGKELLVASDPEEWVTQVERLLDDDVLRSEIISHACRRLATHHSDEALRSALERVLQEATSTHAAGVPP